jgi:triphosphoribosyl-dephospho-CoA synthetase
VRSDLYRRGRELSSTIEARNAVGQQKTLKELVVGAWLLESVYDQSQDGKRMTSGVLTLKGLSCSIARGDFLSRLSLPTGQNPHPITLAIPLAN